MTMSVLTNAENSFLQTYITHNLSETRQKWSETAYTMKTINSERREKKEGNFTLHKLVSANYHQSTAKLALWILAMPQCIDGWTLVTYKYVNKIMIHLFFFKVDPQTLGDTEPAFGYAYNIRYAGHNRGWRQNADVIAIHFSCGYYQGILI